MSINRVVLVGRLTRDPELKTTTTGKSVSDFSIAVNKRVKPTDGSSDADFFREWARIACWHHYAGPFERKYNVGIIFKRAQGHGTITNIVGLRRYVERFGAHIVEDRLLRPGTPRRDWKATLLSDGYLVVRHPDWDAACEMAFAAATDIKMYAS